MCWHQRSYKTPLQYIGDPLPAALSRDDPSGLSGGSLMCLAISRLSRLGASPTGPAGPKPHAPAFAAPERSSADRSKLSHAASRCRRGHPVDALQRTRLTPRGSPGIAERREPASRDGTMYASPPQIKLSLINRYDFIDPPLRKAAAIRLLLVGRLQASCDDDPAACAGTSAQNTSPMYR